MKLTIIGVTASCLAALVTAAPSSPVEELGPLHSLNHALNLTGPDGNSLHFFP